MKLDSAASEASTKARIEFSLDGATGHPSYEWVGDPEGRLTLSEILLKLCPWLLERLPWRLVKVETDSLSGCAQWVRHIAFDSKIVKSVAYDAPTLRMEVALTTGPVYQYVGVTPERHRAFVTAESLGQHFNKEIRGKYQTTRVE
jgi:hypothetical protein